MRSSVSIALVVLASKCIAISVQDIHATYEVYPWHVSDPTKGSRVKVTDPWNIEASPFTWHSDGVNIYNYTRGNNGIVVYDWLGESTSNGRNLPYPESATMDFSYPYSPDNQDFQSYANASATQLWYTFNMYHDLLYLLGFNEAAGNYQQNNSNKGGKEEDGAYLLAQQPFGNNAEPLHDEDGKSGGLQLHMYNIGGIRDPSFDKGLVIHEFTHLVSMRLNHGLNYAPCLEVEPASMNEGRSDFMAIATQVRASDTRDTDFPYTPWIENRPMGRRNFPYSTNISVNNLTYNNVDSPSLVDEHEKGAIWATALYEVLWNLIDIHGISDDIWPAFNGRVPRYGHHLTMKLVLDGLARQPCNSTFIDARDAFITAEADLTGGVNKCAIWKGFAKRGLGVGARKTSNDTTVEDFAVPQGC